MKRIDDNYGWPYCCDELRAMFGNITLGIEYLPEKNPDDEKEGWYITHDSRNMVEIKYCPFCGEILAALTYKSPQGE